MKKIIRKESALLIPNQGLKGRLRAIFTPLGPLDILLHQGYHPYGTNKNPLVHTFKMSGKGTEQPLDLDPTLELVLICHSHQFIGLVTPKYYGQHCASFVVCPFCTEERGFIVELTTDKLTKALTQQDAPYMHDEDRYLHITGAWKRLRKKFPNYSHRWTYIGGVPVRVDNDGKGTQLKA